MGRAPCCDKANVKKGPWSPEEDAKLKSYIDQHGTGGNWIALPQKIGLKRCGKSCRLRWLNYLRPNIKHGGFSEEEDNIICSLYISIGSRWSIIAAQLPGRTDNDIKNYWNTRLKKKLLGKQRREKHNARGKETAKGKQKYSDSLNVAPPPPLPVLQPIPYSDEEPRFNNHASIRRLLIKLGGRFSSQDQNSQHLKLADQIHHQIHFPAIDDQTLVQPMCINDPMDQLVSSSGQIPNSLNATVAFPPATTNVPNFDLVGAETSPIFLPKSSIGYENQEKLMQLQGLEFFYDDLMNRSAWGWGEMNPWGFAPSASSSDQGLVQGPSPLEEFDEEKMRYLGT